MYKNECETVNELNKVILHVSSAIVLSSQGNIKVTKGSSVCYDPHLVEV